jgi:DNA mismatch endonuclease, patch repair protein
MSRFRSRDSEPEQLMRAALSRAGVSYVAYPKLSGTPDIQLVERRILVFVHGCFWHGCRLHYREPKRRQGYWREKLARNTRRDRATFQRLRRAGWSVRTVWECEVLANADRMVRRLIQARGGTKGQRPAPFRDPYLPPRGI